MLYDFSNLQMIDVSNNGRVLQFNNSQLKNEIISYLNQNKKEMPVVYVRLSARYLTDKNQQDHDLVDFKIGKGTIELNENNEIKLTREIGSNQGRTIDSEICVLLDLNQNSNVYNTENNIRNELLSTLEFTKTMEDKYNIIGVEHIHIKQGIYEQIYLFNNVIEDCVNSMKKLLEFKLKLKIQKKLLKDLTSEIRIKNTNIIHEKIQNIIENNIITNDIVFKNKKAFLLNSFTGYGKTVETLNIANKFFLKNENKDAVIIISPKPNTLDEVENDCNEFEEFKDINVIRIKGNQYIESNNKGTKFIICLSIPGLKKRTEDTEYFDFEDENQKEENDVVSYSFKTLKKIIKNKKLNCNCICVDECHEGVQTNETKEVVDQIEKIIESNYFLLRISATAEYLLNDHFQSYNQNTSFILNEVDRVNFINKKGSGFEEQPEINYFITAPYDEDFIENKIKSNDIIAERTVKPNTFIQMININEDNNIKLINEINKVSYDINNEKMKDFYDENLIKNLESLKEELIKKKKGYFNNENKRIYSSLIYVKEVIDGDNVADGLEKLFQNPALKYSTSLVEDFEIIKIYGNNKHQSAKELNKRILKNKKNNKHSFVISCGRFATGSNLPELTELFILTNISSSTFLRQLIGRLHRVTKLTESYQGKYYKNVYFMHANTAVHFRNNIVISYCKKEGQILNLINQNIPKDITENINKYFNIYDSTKGIQKFNPKEFYEYLNEYKKENEIYIPSSELKESNIQKINLEQISQSIFDNGIDEKKLMMNYNIVKDKKMFDKKIEIVKGDSLKNAAKSFNLQNNKNQIEYNKKDSEQLLQNLIVLSNIIFYYILYKNHLNEIIKNDKYILNFEISNIEKIINLFKNNIYLNYENLIIDNQNFYNDIIDLIIKPNLDTFISHYIQTT